MCLIPSLDSPSSLDHCRVCSIESTNLLSVMLSAFRNFQKWLIIFITIAVVIGFAFLYSDYDFIKGTLGKRNCVAKVDGKCIDDEQIMKLASNLQVANRVGLFDYSRTLFGERQDDDLTEFAMGLLTLRNEAKAMGIEPSDTEIKQAVARLPIFQQPWADQDFVKAQILQPAGFTDSDFYQLVKDSVALEQLKSLVTAGISPQPDQVETVYLGQNRVFTGNLITFPRESFNEQSKPTDEEISTYYEDNKPSLLSSPKRGFQALTFTPKELPEDATSEDKAKARLAFPRAVNEAYTALSLEGADFAKQAQELAKASNPDFDAEFSTIQPFARNEAPDPFSNNTQVLGELFSEQAGVGSVTIPLTQPGGGFAIYHYSEFKEPSQLTLEEAKPAIVEALTTKKANQSAKEAAEKFAATLDEKLKGGAKIGQAIKPLPKEAKALDLKEVTFAEDIPDTDYDRTVYSAFSDMNKGDLSETLTLPAGDGYAIAYLGNVKVYKSETKEEDIREITASMEVGMRDIAFQEWFEKRSSGIRGNLVVRGETGEQPEDGA